MSDPDRALDLVYLGGVLVLVVSALVARRVPLRHGAKMAGAWILIFAVLLILVAYKDELVGSGRKIWRQAVGETVDPTPKAEARSFRIRKSPDGHFWVYGRINGVKAHFLIDSGATITSISLATADRAGVDYRGDFPTLVETANGVIPVRRGRAQTLAVGNIVRRDLAVHVSESFGDTDVLGMNFLSSLSSWGVEGPWLVLTP